MSIETSLETNTSFQTPSDLIPDIIGPYSKKLKVSLLFDPETDLAQQEFKDDADINTIMARYLKTGHMDYVNKHEPQYGDVTAVDFREAMETVAKGKSMFADLPSATRDFFENDPVEFLRFVNDPRNAKQAAEMGLLSDEATSRILNPTPEPAKAPEGSKEPAPKTE